MTNSYLQNQYSIVISVLTKASWRCAQSLYRPTTAIAQGNTSCPLEPFKFSRVGQGAIRLAGILTLVDGLVDELHA